MVHPSSRHWRCGSAAGLAGLVLGLVVGHVVHASAMDGMTLSTIAAAVPQEAMIRKLGETDDEAARERLLRELDTPSSAAVLDAAIHALARQGEPRARDRIAAIGADAVATRSGNTTHEQARRMSAVAFYQLTLARDTLSEGLAMLGQLALPDQENTAAWAVQTLCERSARRPANAAQIDGQRRALTSELERLGVRWDHRTRGAVPCS